MSQEIERVASIIRATPILPEAVVDYEVNGRPHRLGVRGPTAFHVESKLEAIVRGLIREGKSFSVERRG